MIGCFWSWLVCNAAAVSAIAAVIAVFITIWSLHSNLKIEKARLRPIVSASIKCHDNIYQLVISNIGLSAAYEIKVSASPPIKIDLHPEINGEIPFIEHPIPILLPSASLNSAFVSGYESLKAISHEMRFVILLAYKDEDGKEYCSSQKLDVRLIANAALLKGRSGDEILANAIRDAASRLSKSIEGCCKHRQVR